LYSISMLNTQKKHTLSYKTVLLCQLRQLACRHYQFLVIGGGNRSTRSTRVCKKSFWYQWNVKCLCIPHKEAKPTNHVLRFNFTLRYILTYQDAAMVLNDESPYTDENINSIFIILIIWILYSISSSFDFISQKWLKYMYNNLSSNFAISSKS
jgi:hypothetical protein